MFFPHNYVVLPVSEALPLRFATLFLQSWTQIYIQPHQQCRSEEIMRYIVFPQ